MTCAACAGETDAAGKCARCGLSPADIAEARSPALRAYERARSLAAEGRFAEAQAEIAEAKRAGLADDATVARLEALCVLALTNVTAPIPVPSPNPRGRESGNETGVTNTADAGSSPLETLLPLPDSPLPREPKRAAVGRGVGGEGLFSFAIGAAISLSVVAILLATIALVQRPQAPQTIVVTSPTPAASPAPPAISAIGASPAPISSSLPPNLRRDYGEARKATDEQTARRWLNEGLRAYRNKEFSVAETMGNAAYTVGGGTYLAEDALLLSARAADNRNDPHSPELWARLADERPGSAYAPTALKMAAQAARRQGRNEIAEKYLDRLRGLGRTAETSQRRIE